MMITKQVVGFDLGNGYMKRTYDGKKVFVDPAVYAPMQEAAFNLAHWDNIAVINKVPAILGKESLIAKMNVKYAVGEDDFSRYESDEYRDLLLATIVVDLKKSVCIETLVLGLPVQHQKMKLGEKLKKRLEHKTFENVKVNNKVYTVTIKKVVVIPQPMGTYFVKDMIDDLSDDYVLIIDGGFGTIDYTAINQERLLSADGNDQGLKKLYLVIRDQLYLKYPGIKLTPHDVQQIITSRKMKYQGQMRDVSDELFNTAISYQFSIILDELISKYNSFVDFDKVIFTGGFVYTFKEQIDKLQREYGNIVVMESPQFANVRGYYLFGKRFSK
jgi:hypothetical protein